MRSIPSTVRSVAISILIAGVSACGGGGSSPAPSAQTGGGDNWVPGVFAPEASFFARCAAPRLDTDPVTGQRLFPDTQGSILDENNWLRSWTNDSYLWYDEILDQDPALFDDPVAYFDELRTTELSDSGNLKDRFHFTFDSAEWIALSRSGISAGYGMELEILSSLPPREVVITFTQPGTPARMAGIARGTRIVGVDGVDLINGSTQAMVDIINAGLFPDAANEAHNFEILDPGAAAARMVQMTSAEITAAPVQDVSTVTSPLGATVGYMHFSDHIATAEAALVNAIAQLDASGIEDLIIDMRYNGGGFLSIASQLAYMIAGPAVTAGRTFELLQFNDKYPTNNPVTGQSLEPILFEDFTLGFSAPPGPLPTLDLDRVFIITGSDTCSASESIINSLRGIDVEVVQIGERTCGKPYGFYPTDNCGTTYFSIQFRGVNDKGFGDYSDGFTPAAGGAVTDTEPPGCLVPDDFDSSLGNVNEARLAAALQYRDTGTCPAATAPLTISSTNLRSTVAVSARQLPIGKEADFLRANRVLLPR